MFTAIYHWRLKPGLEDQFREAWADVTRAIRPDCGSYGSSLFREADGSWSAIACWPSAEARDACSETSPADPSVVARMRDAIEERLETRELELDTYLWGGDVRESL